MSSSSVEKIKERLDIAEVIGSYIKLEKAGASFKGKCPFHNEKTPSFFVSPARGSFYCFGCGVKGDMFTFVQDIEGVDFISALKALAERAGVVLEDYNPQKIENVSTLYDILEKATAFFQASLAQSSEAKTYLTKRSIKDETTLSWRLGYAPPEWRLLMEHLKGQGFKEEDMVKAGLIKHSEKANGDSYDVFRGRIIFPIFDGSGRPIAFSGRLLVDDDKSPKYLNSPETELFSKSETLYGLDRAKMDMRKKGYAILVEGQFDLIACHQAGFTNTVASSGTAFTQMHLAKLSRLVKKLMLAFDSDPAGLLASEKSAALALSLGMEVKIITLPSKSDPADFIAEDLEGWKDSLRGAKHIIDFQIDRLVSEAKDERQLAKEIEKRILPYLALLSSSIEQSHFISRIAKKTRIREEAIWSDLRKIPRPSLQNMGQESSTPAEKKEAVRKNDAERRLIGSVWWLEGREEDLDPTSIRIRLVSIAGDEYVAEMFRRSEDEREAFLFEVESYYGDSARLEKDLDELFFNFEEDILKDRFVSCMSELQKAEEQKDEKRTEELLQTCHEITAQLALLAKKKL